MNKTKGATSPAASGPAGSQFEGQVGAQYLLTMLVGGEPRGLPGTTIDRVEFQRASEGRPLDDVIVHAHDTLGAMATLEIQVKRSVTFAPADPVFRDVVEQIVKAARRTDFWSSRYELAIAAAKTSWKIAGAYQEVLTWAKKLDSAKVFFERLARKGSASDDMRTFVATFRANLNQFGSASDDETVWRLLGRLQILTFDFTAEGSASEDLAKERSVRALNPDESPRAGALWTVLIGLAIRIASVGGDSTVASLAAELGMLSFRLAGQRRFSAARAAIAESSRNALADIVDRVGDVTLSRIDRLTEIQEARDRGGYVEILGDTGVGKSGLLKHLAGQIATEAGVLVLSPGRTPPRGWAAMRAELGFDGSARELLADMAGDGAAVIFIDNLDLFTPDERNTVVDLIRAAAEVPGVTVVTTARRTADTEEPSWLPGTALDQLGRTGPITITELSDAEIDELRLAAPGLARLLTDVHPARDVIRNLYRLGRLADRPLDEPAPRTEIDMAVQWWQTADGKPDSSHRDRSRLLRALARHALSTSGPLDVTDQPSKAVDELKASATLRELAGDRVAFRHDVLREWGIANYLTAEPAEIENLPLDRPAPAALARGIELSARIALERNDTSASWVTLLERVSRHGVHGSWRRAVLLALVRSEVASSLLTRVEHELLADGAAALRELIRTTMAVDVVPAAPFWVALGVDPAAIPSTLNVPSAPSWHRLIGWLLALGQRLPSAAIPDVVDLYTAWSQGMVGTDPITPTLLKWLHHWLVEIETTRDGNERREPFGGGIPYGKMRDLESALRTGFLSFCHRSPELAVSYLTALKARPHTDSIVESILRFRGLLAQAAPAELAELTATALIRMTKPGSSRHGYDIEGPFGFFDHQFLPESPAQGPFLELLTYAPRYGLPLIRRLVDHAVVFHSHGKPHGANAITIQLPDGERSFPWINTYNWPRSGGSNHYCVTSALMALEAWAHKRIENGDDIDTVMSDVLGEPGAPAAYLLVAVDILLSHWPKSAESAVPFLASPDLLSLDRERHVHDNMPFPDVFGLNALQKEPVGSATLANLKSRPSRRRMLETLLAQYAMGALPEARERLSGLLKRQAAILGEPDAKADMRDPALMARHALNLIDPANWADATVTLVDGTEAEVKQYVAPEAEARHLGALQEARADGFASTSMEARLGLAIDEPSKSSPKLAKDAVGWALGQADTQVAPETDGGDTRRHSIVTAAMIAMRDGDDALRRECRAWADGVFSSALQVTEDAAHRFRSGLRFNPPAIAFAGIVHGLRDAERPEDRRTLLETAARSNAAAAHGLGATAVVLAAADERLPRALLRCAFIASIRDRRPDWDAPKEIAAANAEAYRLRCEDAVAAEESWLSGKTAEPAWPAFPMEAPRPRRRIRLPGGNARPPEPVRASGRNDEYVDHQAAALWLANCRSLFDAGNRPWLLQVLRTYSDWTANANGAGLAAHEDLTSKPTEWNSAYFDLLANSLPSMPPAAVDELALDPIRTLPDEPFLDVTTTFLRDVDGVFFNGDRLSAEEAVRVRSVLADRLVETSGWHSMIRRRSSSIETHLGAAAGVVFFNNHGFTQPATAYLYAKGIDRIPPFLPLLERLARDAPSLFIAVVTLNLLEVSPRSEHAPLLMNGVKAWVAAFPDDIDFWINHGVGRRVCALVDMILIKSKSLFDDRRALRPDVDDVLAAMVRVGVAEANRLEHEIAGA